MSQTDLYKKTQASKEAETEAWKNMVDSIIDFLSASKTMLQILTEKLSAAEVDKKDSRKKIIKRSLEDRIRQKFLKDFLQMEMKEPVTLKELHVNKLFNEKSETNSKAAYYEKRLFEKFENVPKPRSPSELLDKQYNLTKQAIARRYQTQNRIVPVTKSNDESKRDYFAETFTEGLYRINNVASESIQLRRNYDDVCVKTPKVTAGNSSHEETYVLYEKLSTK